MILLRALGALFLGWAVLFLWCWRRPTGLRLLQALAMLLILWVLLVVGLGWSW